MIPNLYLATLNKPQLKLAASDPFGTVTLWTYFNNCLLESARKAASSKLTDHDIREAAEIDLVYASFLVFEKTLDVKLGKANEQFIRLLNRCVISNGDIVDGSASFMHEETGISPLEIPSILQILLAVTIKHHNHDVLEKLACCQASDRGILGLAYPLIVSQLQVSKAPAAVFKSLVAGGWIKASDIPDGSGEVVPRQWDQSTDLHNAGQIERPGAKLKSCAQDLPSTELRTYFPRIPRSLYDCIPPHHKWPGDPVLVKFAAARTDLEGLEVMKLLVEIGGMNVNDSETWWKAGDYDPREWNSKCHDGSDCQETALHIAVDKANFSTIEYLLTHGAKSMKDGYGRDQFDRAVLRGRQEVVQLFKKHGWKKD
ncbi:hypothetical protein B0T10DRAFT_76133 [Thelonectria olida]|uniref:Ankyrin n=1 Tax=Thelonectria olida TaxID=1576542 RepID=A0A9P8W497_9HYPO|nr:hypothetical protein B0T10DRAFT_76133 [Thelonectria olida]